MKSTLISLLLFHLLLFFDFGHCLQEKWDEYDDEDLALSIPADAVGIDAQFREKVIERMKSRNKLHDIPENRCYCNYGPEICGNNNTCIKHEKAACYHSIEERYNKKNKRMETWHKYGCASLERGSGASHLTCNSWRAAHHTPRSIACCYSGDYCNKNIEPPPYAKLFEHERPDEIDGKVIKLGKRRGVEMFLTIGGTIILIALCFLTITCTYYKKKVPRTNDSQKTNSTYMETQGMLYEDSGSGSGQATLLQRTVRQDLSIIKTIGQGRYGEVRKARYRGSYVAVKTFCTTDEDSWKNERDVYQTHMINHENILQFVAADIWSEEDSMTKMLLVTDYHELGSLSDYLRREETLSTDEALRLIHSCLCGIEHLHSAVRGTGSYRKPEIAHRDIKSKNIIVKRPNVCCIADLGLALRFDNDKILPSKFNVQVGTKRYMAPELLTNTLNPRDFSQFKMADIYSMALVMWEVARRVEDNPSTEITVVDEIRNEESESSGFDSLSSSNGVIGIVHRQKKSIDISLKAKPYVPPFDGYIETDPSFEEMCKVVCKHAVRPPIEDAWVQGNNIALYELTKLMKDSWHMNPQYRHTAMKLKLETQMLIELADKNRTHKNSHSLMKNASQDADSGISQNKETNSSKQISLKRENDIILI